MKFVVGNKEFTDYSEAQAYEETLKKEEADRSKVLAEVIEKNIHILKYKDNETNSIGYIAVGVDSNGVSSGCASFPKNIAYAMLEKENGARYSYTTVNGYISVKELWSLEKITPEELNSVRIDIFNYLNNSKRCAGRSVTHVTLGQNKNIDFYDMLFDVKSDNHQNERQQASPMSFEEFLANMCNGKFPSGYFFIP